MSASAFRAAKIAPLTSQVRPTADTAHLTYYGGPVISNVKVVSISWNANVAFRDALGGFYSTVTNSEYLDWLSEYNTPSGQSIGRGALVQSVTDTAAPTSTNLTDQQLQTELSRLIDTGTVIAPDGNTVYMVHLPPGFVISVGSSQSCVAFCAYHGTYVKNGKYVVYGVIPDMGGGCYSGCGSADKFGNTTLNASHELVETITDPAAGLATQLGAPLAWYDASHGEIGDICAGQPGNVGPYVVQKEWSNQANACIVSRPHEDFRLSLSNGTETLAAGESASLTISTNWIAGATDDVTLSIAGLAAGVTATLDPSSVTMGGSSNLTLSVSSNARAGTSTFTVLGNQGNVQHAVTGTLIIRDNTPPTISLVSPDPGSTLPRGAQSFEFDVSDDVAIDDVVLSATNGVGTISCNHPPKTWSCTRDDTLYTFTGSMGNGLHRFSATATDSSGNASQTPSYTVRIIGVIRGDLPDLPE